MRRGIFERTEQTQRHMWMLFSSAISAISRNCDTEFKLRAEMCSGLSYFGDAIRRERGVHMNWTHTHKRDGPKTNIILFIPLHCSHYFTYRTDKCTLIIPLYWHCVTATRFNPQGPIFMVCLWHMSTEFYILLTYRLTYSMAHSPSWEANWFCS